MSGLSNAALRKTVRIAKGNNYSAGVPRPYAIQRALLGSIATLGCLAVLGWAAASLRSPRLAVPSVALHHPPADETMWADWVTRLASRWETREVLLDADGEFVAANLADLGYAVDRPALLRSLSENSQSLTPLQQWRQRLSAFADVPLPPKDLPIPWHFDPQRAEETVYSLELRVGRSPTNAAVDFARRSVTHDMPGRRLDVRAVLADLPRFAPSTQDVLELDFIEVPATTTLADLPPVDARKLLATFDTDFSKKRGPRIHNIRQAASYLDGSVLAPGATLSFNKIVGHRVAERGFVDAPVIVNDVMESGMGGGVCQVATTLHAAAVYGGLEITERRSHSRPSGYAPLGLDATVIDDVQDLRIKNPYSVPVYIRAYLPSRYVVRVELFGVELDGKVKHSNWVVERHAFTRRVVEKPELTPGTVKVSQKGGFGYDTVSTVVLTSNGHTREYRYKSKYYPVPEVLWIGPGTHPDALPPLPEAAEPNPSSEQTM